MKFTLLLCILFELLAKRKLTAAYLAEKHEISTRTVYRYVEILSSHAPVYVKRGRDGGIFISEHYKLPVNFMTATEYDAAIEALTFAYSHTLDEKFLTAKRKLSAQTKEESRNLQLIGAVENILIDGEAWGDARATTEKIRLIEECLQEKRILEVEYCARTGERQQRRIEPHVLVFQRNAWLLYAFCHTQRDFRFFRIGRLLSLHKSAESFRRRPFEREALRSSPLAATDGVFARLAFQKEALAQAQDWLGVENLRKKEGVWYADIYFHSQEYLLEKLLSFGGSVQVVEPLALRERVLQAARKIVETYR